MTLFLSSSNRIDIFLPPSHFVSTSSIVLQRLAQSCAVKNYVFFFFSDESFVISRVGGSCLKLPLVISSITFLKCAESLRIAGSVSSTSTNHTKCRTKVFFGSLYQPIRYKNRDGLPIVLNDFLFSWALLSFRDSRDAVYICFTRSQDFRVCS